MFNTGVEKLQSTQADADSLAEEVKAKAVEVGAKVTQADAFAAQVGYFGLFLFFGWARLRGLSPEIRRI